MNDLTDLDKFAIACLIGTVIGSVVVVAIVMIFVRA